jgi:hypothetical protein
LLTERLDPPNDFIAPKANETVNLDTGNSSLLSPSVVDAKITGDSFDIPKNTLVLLGQNCSMPLDILAHNTTCDEDSVNPSTVSKKKIVRSRLWSQIVLRTIPISAARCKGGHRTISLPILEPLFLHPSRKRSPVQGFKHLWEDRTASVPPAEPAHGG